MKNLLFTFAVSLMAALFSGCGHTPPRETLPAATPPHTAGDALAASRAAAFSKVIKPAMIRGVGIFPAAFFDRFPDDEVLNAAERLGFNRLYCHLTSERELNDRLAAFITLAVRRKFSVELVFSQQDFYRRYRSNRLIRGFLIQYPDLCEALAGTVGFERSLPEDVRLSGVTVVLTPHLFSGNNIQRMRGQLYRWDGNRYGAGGDNDMLIGESLALARRISEIPGLPRLTVSIPDFFNEAAKEGKLSRGFLKDFAAVSRRVAVISTANLPSRIPASLKDELDDAPLDTSVLLVVPLAGHTSVDTGRLRRRNWDDFHRSIANLMNKHSGHPAFGGIIVSPLAIIEFLRMEK